MYLKLKATILMALLGAIVPGPSYGISLWNSPRNTGRNIVADPRARIKGDILTVIVSEISNINLSQATTTGKTASITDAVTSWLFPDSAFGTHNGQYPSTNISGKNAYTGSGTLQNQQTFTATISVTVIDVLPNGNLVVGGVRKMLQGGEIYYNILEGVVRQQDIASNNQILSSQIADARIDILTEGDLTDAQDEGWLLKINNFLNPF